MSQTALKQSQCSNQPQWFLDLLNLQTPPNEGDKFVCNGKDLVMKNNIIRAIEAVSTSQGQTKETFAYKWKQRSSFETDVSIKFATDWMNSKYGNFDALTFEKRDNEKITVLDAGCGAGLSGFCYFQPYFERIKYIGADISSSVDIAKERSAQYSMDAGFVQCDLNKLPLPEKSIDVIFSEGVLHHTDSTEQAFYNLAQFVKDGGYFMFYVYRTKGPIREFVDDHLRDKLKNMELEQAWKSLGPLTKLGKTLGELDIEIDIEEPIDLLEIPAGKINLQRFFYWNVMKAFYSPHMTLEEMNHINYDWYTPVNAHRQTLDDIRTWCKNANFSIVRENEEESGITIIAKRT